MKLDCLNPSGANPADKGNTVLFYGVCSGVCGFAAHFAARDGYTIIISSSPHNAPTVGPAKVIDHTQPAKSVIAELKAVCLYDAVFDTIRFSPVTVILVQVFVENGGDFHNNSPPIGPLELLENVQWKMESFPAAIEQPQNEEFREWFYGVPSKYLGNWLSDKLLAPGKVEKIAGELEEVQGCTR